MIKYNKLVRDKIPDILRSEGEKCTTKIIGEEEFIKRLDGKLYEEITEYFDSKDVEELVDIMEVIYAIAKAKGYSATALDKLRKEKCNNKGGFNRRVVLLEVDDK